MEEMWQANCTVIRNVLRDSGIAPGDVAGVAVCGHGKGLYLWGKDGRPTRNGIISTDNRAYAYPQKWRADGTEDRVFALSCQHILALDALPPLCEATDIAGHVSPEAAAQCGLKPGTPVAGGMFDIDACALAVNVLNEDRVCMIAGTWSINEYPRKAPVTDGSVLMNSLFFLKDLYLIEAIARRMCPVGARVEPDPDVASSYERRYALYRRIIDCLDPIWDDMQACIEGE